MSLDLIDARASPTPLTGRHVLLAMIAFFGLIFAVNGYFLYAALSTHTGLVAVEPYRKGLAYNQRIAAAERQTQLGWTESLSVEASGRVALGLATPMGEAAHGLQITGVIGRPSTERHDRLLRFVEKDRQYIADAGPLPTGGWIVTIVARADTESEPVFRVRRRLWLKP